MQFILILIPYSSDNDFDSDIDLFIACTILQKQIQYIDGKKDKILVPSIALRKGDENAQTGNGNSFTHITKW